jgi:hypothetical protein
MLAMKQYINGIHTSELRYKAKEMGISETTEVYEAYKVIQRAQALLDDLQKEKQDEAFRSLMAQTTLHASTHQNRPARQYPQPQPQLVPQPYQSPVQPQVQQPPAPSAQPNQQPLPFPLRSSDWQRPLPDRSLSSHPFINRTAQYLRSAGLLCTCCGVLGHLTRECTGEELSGWEQFYLRGILREALQFQPRPVRSNMAQVASAPRDWSALISPQSQQYQQPQFYGPSDPPFQYDANRAAPSSANVNPNTLTYEAPQLELEDLQGANVGSLHVELVRSLESRYAEHKELKKKPQEVVDSFYGDRKRLRQARDDISDEWAGETQVVNRPAPAPSQPAKLPDNHPILSADRHRRHHRMRRSASTERVPRAAYQPPTVEDIPEIITEDIVDEEALQETADQRARSEAEVTVQAPQTSVQADPLIPDIQPVVQDQPGIRRRPRISKELKQIVGRIGLKPVNYRDMATDFKVTITLLDLLQISPDFAKQLRKLSTRVNEKKKRRDPTQSSHLAYLTVPQSDPPPALVSSLSANIPPERHKSGYPMIVSTLASDKAWRIPVVSKVKYNRVVDCLH